MEVTNVADKVTHAVIGRGEVESFGMSEDAELYHILSSALYSRKKEAAVREILCNGWDSHIESGITDIPLQITLDGNKLSVRDFGAGLHPTQIKPVYGTYGKSTKKHDGRQTGGFGLGSKAPFAYTDHFEVISCHDSLKSIYKMSQSNAEVGGKPSITTIVRVPTDESGLQVSFNLKDSEDRHEFESLIRRIVEMGDMNATLNGRELDTIPFTESPHGFMLVRAERFGKTSYTITVKDPIMVRYGHVVYPLNSDDRFAHLYDRTVEFLGKLSPTDRYGNSTKWVLVLEAAPHTISVVPSREDLSMTDKTVATVTDLLRRFINQNGGKFEATVTEMFEDAINKVGLVGTPKMLFEHEKSVPLIDKVPNFNGNYVYDFDQLSRVYLKQSYPQFQDFRTKDLRMKVDALIQTGFGNRGILQSFKSEMLGRNRKETVSQWFLRRVVNLALRNHLTTKAVSPDRLYIYTMVGRGRYRTDNQPGFIPATQWVSNDIDKALPLLRNLVILTCTRAMHVMERADDFPICRHWVGIPVNSLCYAVQRNAQKIDAARQHFEKMGFTVIDLTKAQPWEHQDVMKPVARAAPRPRKKGIPCLAAGILNGEFQTTRLFEDGAERIEKPEFIVKISSQRGNSPSFCNFGSTVSRAIARRYGKKGGVVQNSTQEEKLFNEGASVINKWLVDRLVEEYKTNSALEEHYRFSVAHRTSDPNLSLNWDQNRIFKIIRKTKDLAQMFKLPDPIGEKEQDIIAIFEHFNRYDRRIHAGLEEIDKIIATWTLNPKAKRLVSKLKTSKLLQIIKEDMLESILDSTSGRYNKHEVETARKILLLAVEG